MPKLTPALQPQILVGQIFTRQQLLSKEEGGAKPVARGLSRLLPALTKERVSHTVLPSPPPPPYRRGYIPLCTHILESPLPMPPAPTKPQAGKRTAGLARGNLIPGLPGPPPTLGQLCGLKPCQIPLPNLLFSGGWRGGWSKHSGYSEGEDAEG